PGATGEGRRRAGRNNKSGPCKVAVRCCTVEDCIPRDTMKALLQERHSDVSRDSGNHFAVRKPLTPTSSVGRSEHEADSIAEQVVQSKPVGTFSQPGELKHLPSTHTLPDVLVSGQWSPLPESIRELVNPHLAFDFSQVRIHANPEAASLAESLDAQ